MKPAQELRQSLRFHRWLPMATLVASFLATPLTAKALAPVSKPSIRTVRTPHLAKAETVARLRTLQVKLTSDIAALENSSKKRLQESTTITLKQDLNVASQKILRLADQIEDIERKRAELLSKRDFLNQLTLLVDSKWDGQNLQKFLEHTLLDIATTELISPEGASPTWRFATYLSIAVREIPEGRDDVLGVMESYLGSSSILNPKTPAEFAGRRDYTNDVMAVTARPVPRDQAGDGVEEKVRHLNQALGGPPPPSAKITNSASSAINHAPAGEPKADIELSLKQPMPQPSPPSAAEAPQPPAAHAPKTLPPSP